MEIPLVWQPSREDGSGTYKRVGFWEHILFNLTFNLGYMVQDFMWITRLKINEGDDYLDEEKRYFYRYGFVMGDIYMRWFFRTLQFAPEKIVPPDNTKEETI